MKTWPAIIALLGVLGGSCGKDEDSSLVTPAKRDAAGPRDTAASSDAGLGGADGSAAVPDAAERPDAAAAVSDGAPVEAGHPRSQCMSYRTLYCQRYLECMWPPTMPKADGLAVCESIFDSVTDCQRASGVSGNYGTCMEKLAAAGCGELGQEARRYTPPASCIGVVVIKLGV